MMRIVVFGSTGKAGQETVRQAIERGHAVMAYARSPGKIDFKHEALTVVQGSLEDTVLLERVITGADCVISLLGPGGNTRDTALSDGVGNIIAAMEKVGIRRLIQIATASARDPQDRRDLRFGLMVTLIKRMAPGAYAEIVRIAEAVRASRLDWTLVRVPLLNEKPQTKSVRVGYLGQGTVKTAISRADLAWFMLEQVKSDDHVRKAPAISN
jgi:putative NADH-flavin reductase